MAIFLLALQLLFRLVFWLPVDAALAVMYATAWLISAIAVRTPVKRMVKKNIETVLKRADAEQLAGKLLGNFSRSILELLCLPFFNHHHFQRVVRFEGLENLPRGQGAIMLTMHVGNYELSHAALSDLGFKAAIVLRAEKDPLFELVNRSRGAHGAQLINVLEDDMYQESLKALNQHKLVYILGDTGALESRHEMLDFLGHKVPVATGWLTLAQRTGCPVLPILTHRAKGVNVFTIFPPAVVTRDNRDEVLRNFVRVSEEFIRQHPEEWGMFLNEYETNRMVKGR
jgi:lauroyl/myristoyl acyltransferase